MSQLFKNRTAQDIWVEHNCPGCYRHDNNPNNPCPILAKAVRTQRKPVEWDRNTRNNILMSEAYRCNAKSKTPPARPKVDVDVPMFDVATPVTMDTEHS